MFDNPHRIQGLKATKSEVENALIGNYNIFNFYGYASEVKVNPSASEILLVGEDKITIKEICTKPLKRYNLFTLSASEIAASKQKIATEYAGLTSGLLSQGVSNVVNSLWRVESTANALLIIEFYRRLQTQTPVVALAEAVEWLRELTAGELTKWYESLLNQLPPEGLRMKAQLATQLYRTRLMEADTILYNHPYYWAAFVIGGIDG